MQPPCPAASRRPSGARSRGSVHPPWSACPLDFPTPTASRMALHHAAALARKSVWQHRAVPRRSLPISRRSRPLLGPRGSLRCQWSCASDPCPTPPPADRATPRSHVRKGPQNPKSGKSGHCTPSAAAQTPGAPPTLESFLCAERLLKPARAHPASRRRFRPRPPAADASRGSAHGCPPCTGCNEAAHPVPSCTPRRPLNPSRRLRRL
jgi:hypothetical protein